MELSSLLGGVGLHRPVDGGIGSVSSAPLPLPVPCIFSNVVSHGSQSQRRFVGPLASRLQVSWVAAGHRRTGGWATARSLRQCGRPEWRALSPGSHYADVASDGESQWAETALRLRQGRPRRHRGCGSPCRTQRQDVHLLRFAVVHRTAALAGECERPGRRKKTSRMVAPRKVACRRPFSRSGGGVQEIQFGDDAV